MKELFEAFNARLRAPLLGNFFIAFIFVNWKSMLFLIFGDVGIETRIERTHSDVNSLNGIALPAVAALLLTAAQPG